MQIFPDPSTPFYKKSAVMLGNFDGFHRAHALLAENTVRLAKEKGLVPAALLLLSPPDKGPALSDEAQKLHFLENAGIGAVFSFSFEKVRALSPAEFVQKILIGLCRAEVVACGFNYRFAKDRAGDAEELQKLLTGKADVFVLPPVRDGDGTLISSTAIRTLLEHGQIPDAERLLGHPLFRP